MFVSVPRKGTGSPVYCYMICMYMYVTVTVIVFQYHDSNLMKVYCGSFTNVFGIIMILVYYGVLHNVFRGDKGWH